MNIIAKLTNPPPTPRQRGTLRGSIICYCDKAHAGLNWYSVLTIDECLQMTAAWYKIFYAEPPRDSMYEICTQQIAEYAKRTKKRNLNGADKRATQS